MLSVVDESFLNNDNDSNNFTSYIGYKRWYLDQIVKWNHSTCDILIIYGI